MDSTVQEIAPSVEKKETNECDADVKTDSNQENEIDSAIRIGPIPSDYIDQVNQKKLEKSVDNDNEPRVIQQTDLPEPENTHPMVNSQELPQKLVPDQPTHLQMLQGMPQQAIQNNQFPNQSMNGQMPVMANPMMAANYAGYQQYAAYDVNMQHVVNQGYGGYPINRSNMPLNQVHTNRVHPYQYQPQMQPNMYDYTRMTPQEYQRLYQAQCQQYQAAHMYQYQQHLYERQQRQRRRENGRGYSRRDRRGSRENGSSKSLVCELLKPIAFETNDNSQHTITLKLGSTKVKTERDAKMNGKTTGSKPAKVKQTTQKTKMEIEKTQLLLEGVEERDPHSSLGLLATVAAQYGNDYDRERKEKNDTHDSMLKYVKQATVADNKSEQSIQGKTTRLKNQN